MTLVFADFALFDYWFKTERTSPFEDDDNKAIFSLTLRSHVRPEETIKSTLYLLKIILEVNGKINKNDLDSGRKPIIVKTEYLSVSSIVRPFSFGPILFDNTNNIKLFSCFECSVNANVEVYEILQNFN